MHAYVHPVGRVPNAVNVALGAYGDWSRAEWTLSEAG